MKFVKLCYGVLDMLPLLPIYKIHIVCLLKCLTKANINTPEVILAQWYLYTNTHLYTFSVFMTD